MQVLTVRKLVGCSILNAWAFEMPIKPPGLLSFRQESIRWIPMPGSTTTGMAPVLNKAKVRVKNSGLAEPSEPCGFPG